MAVRNFYREYDTYIEQGGYLSAGNNWSTITLEKQFPDTNYLIFVTPCTTYRWYYESAYIASNNKTTNSFNVCLVHMEGTNCGVNYYTLWHPDLKKNNNFCIKDKMIIQGGYVTNNNGWKTLIFPKAFSNTSYHFLCSCVSNSTYNGEQSANPSNVTPQKDRVEIYSGDNAVGFYWLARGV